MRLTLDQLRAAASGVSYVAEESGSFTFHRFTPAQEGLYKRERSEIAERSLMPAGVKLTFRTDSRRLGIKASFATGTRRRFFSVEVFSNGEKIGEFCNFDEKTIPSNYTYELFKLGDFSEVFELGEGEKELCLHFPWSIRMVLEELTLDDGASFLPVRRAARFLCLGDSITQGYDALHPSRRYAARLADLLSAEEHNKAVGAEIFFPELADLLSEEPAPDYISVAYGTNDWGRLNYEELSKNCHAFFSSLARQFPESELIVITPIWRADREKETPFGLFTDLAKLIGEAAGCHPKAHVIDGLDIYPHDTAFFPDEYLHPNNEGFDHYADGLAKKFRELGLVK